MTDPLTKYDYLVNRLAAKMRMSETPVPGFIMGLSGTDSLISFLMTYDAAVELNLSDRVRGIHYVDRYSGPTWFEREIMPWLRNRCPDAAIGTVVPLGGNFDQQRWADLHTRALNKISTAPYMHDGIRIDRTKITPVQPHQRFWVVGSINSTELALGKYSALANACSLQPIQKVSKSMVIAMCKALGVPEIAIEMSRIPDCLCGRDELAAQNIELIDSILNYSGRSPDAAPALVDKLSDYISEHRATNAFKTRIPYTL